MKKNRGRKNRKLICGFEKYLEGKPMPVDEMITRNMNLCVVDTEKVTILKHPWSKIINMCDVDELINYDIQQQIFINEKEVHFNSPKDAIDIGIGMVHQHFMQVPSMTVAENLILGAEPGTALKVDRKERCGSRQNFPTNTI